MSLYAITVMQPSATQDALTGDFIGNGKQQILTANGTRLAILEVSRRHKGFQELYSQDVFGVIRRIAKFRIAGGTKGMSLIFETPKASIVILQGAPHPRARCSLSPQWTGLASLVCIACTNLR